MHKSLAFLILLLLPFSLFAQDVVDNNNSTPKVVKPSRDFFMLQLGYTGMADKPDSVKFKGIGRTLNVFLCYDFPIKKSNLSFAAGIGISANALNLNKQTISFSDTGALGASARVLNDTTDMKRFKFGTTYVTAPFELRYFGNASNRNRGFKAAVGVQVGLLLGGKTKEVNSVSGSIIKDKVNTKRYLSPWNIAATARFGWGNFSVYGSYNLSKVFKDGEGPALTPYTVGICLTGL